MAEQYGTAHIHGMSGASIGSIAAVSPNLQGGSLAVIGGDDEIKNQAGEVTGLIGSNHVLEATFEFIPEGTTISNARVAATLPKVNAPVLITGMPIVACAGFTDAYNTNGGNTQPWFFKSGRINHLADGKWTGTFTLRRYLLVTSGTPLA